MKSDREKEEGNGMGESGWKKVKNREDHVFFLPFKKENVFYHCGNYFQPIEKLFFTLTNQTKEKCITLNGTHS